MREKAKTTDAMPLFAALIFTGLAVQLIGRYHATHVWIIGRYFYGLWVALRIAVPLLLVGFIGIPFREIGLARPHLDKSLVRLVAVLSILIGCAFVGVYFSADYLGSYAWSFQGGGMGKLNRFLNFMIFTASTLIGWEFFHRGFLLLGTHFLLTKRQGLDARTATTIAISIVWIFETVFHFIKPEMEALGLLFASPLLSWLAIRSKSVLIPFLLHLTVEILFIGTLLLRSP